VWTNLLARAQGKFTCRPLPFIVEAVNALEATLEIKNRLGLHLRAASTLADTVKKFNATVMLGNGAQAINARSVTNLIMLGAGQGTKLKIKVDGPEAHAALTAIKELFEQRFNEE
jgi:phosphocarrier protein NPr